MPTYEYRCRNCGHQFDVQQSFTDDPLTECPNCGGELRKLFSSPAIAFKGSGFYKNDSRTGGSSSSSSSSGSASKSSDSSTESSSTSDSSSKTETKAAPATKSDSASGSSSASSGSSSSSSTKKSD